MKVRINRQELANALVAVTGVVATRTPKPILQCVRIDVLPDHLLLTCTDLEVGLRYTIGQVEVETAGETLVNADTLSRIIRESADEVIALETLDNQVHIRGEDSHFQIVESDVAEFPAVAAMGEESHFEVSQEDLRRLIEWTLFACARESTRYAINGVLFEVKDRLLMVATDGRRLSKAVGDLTRAPAADLPQVIVPPKALSLVGRLPAEADGFVAVHLAENQMILKVGQATVSTSLVEGHFPKYEDVIPQDCDKEVELETTVFLSALRRAALLTNEESKGVRLSFEQGRLVLSSRAPEQGEAVISMPVAYTGEPVEIGFNPHFLIEALKVVTDDKVVFRCSNAKRPGLLQAGELFTYVIMPVSLA